MRLLTGRQLAAVLRCRSPCNHHLLAAFHVPPTSRRRIEHTTSNRRRNTHALRAQSASPPDVGSSPSTSASDRKRLAVFVSGGGSNFRAIHAAILDGSFHADVAAVVTNSPSCRSLNFIMQIFLPRKFIEM